MQVLYRGKRLQAGGGKKLEKIVFIEIQLFKKFDSFSQEKFLV